MKNGMLTIFRKELARFFGDKRTALGTILLPGILIFAVYTFMGSALSDQFSVDEDFVPTIQAINLPDSVAALAGQAGLDIQAAEGTDQSKALIREQELDLLAVFPEGFDNQVAAYEVSSGAPAPAVELYYNSASVETVVLLSKGEIDSKKVRVEFSLEDMDMSVFQKGATYEQIKTYVLKHTGLKVSSLYISQIKRKCGLDVGQNYNLSKKEDAKVPQCPLEKEAAIMEALKYFQMI